jgi:hypothetical protein
VECGTCHKRFGKAANLEKHRYFCNPTALLADFNKEHDPAQSQDLDSFPGLEIGN